MADNSFESINKYLIIFTYKSFDVEYFLLASMAKS